MIWFVTLWIVVQGGANKPYPLIKMDEHVNCEWMAKRMTAQLPSDAPAYFSCEEDKNESSKKNSL